MDEQRALALLREQRHSFLNHLQVISGWLQLGRAERAAQYLNEVSARVAGESEVLRRAPVSLGLLLIEAGLEAETYGVTLRWQIDSPAEAVALEPILAAIRSVGDGATVTVQVGPNGLQVHTA